MRVHSESLSILTLVFENYSEAVAITNESENILYVNKAFTRLTGYSLSDINQRNLSDYFKVQVNAKFDESNTLIYWESNIERLDHSSVWVKVTKSVFDTGTENRWIFTFTNNPTLDHLAGMLKESENRFAALADASPVMIWITDEQNNAYYFNKSWLKFTGKRFEDEVGTGWVGNVHPEDFRQFHAIAQLLNEFKEYTVEYRLRRHDGEYRHVLEIGTPRFLPDGAFAGYMGSCLDITDFKKVQNDLANYTNELKRSNEELEQFAYVASHDMQEPLRMIASYIQLIDNSLKMGKTDGLDEFMKFVTDGVERMQVLIKDLLHFSRLNKKGTPFVQLHMNEVMQIALSNLSARIIDNEATVSYPSMPVIYGDKTQMIRLMQNLIDNAIKFRSAERKPRIEVGVEDDENYYTFSISDNGIGIENKFYNRIFVIFQRLHAQADYDGTGIGLAVCKKIVEIHGGKIWLESEPGKGTTFFFTIKKNP